eukprot:1194721-Prorocentrum_minimum.AAC.7
MDPVVLPYGTQLVSHSARSADRIFRGCQVSRRRVTHSGKRQKGLCSSSEKRDKSTRSERALSLLSTRYADLRIVAQEGHWKRDSDEPTVL